MNMEFYYGDYIKNGIEYKKKYSLKQTIDIGLYTELRKEAEKDNKDVKRAFNELQKRTTSHYCRKMLLAQTKALEFSREVFPYYSFIMSDALTDDWLSTMDWHKKHPTRDHSLHQTLTTYIISQLLGNGDPTKGLMINKNESLLSRCAELIVNGEKMSYLRNYHSILDKEYDDHQNEYNKDWAVEMFYETALIAAQFHDMGYPWNFVKILSKAIDKSSYKESNGILLKHNETFDKIRNRLLIYPYFEYDFHQVMLMNDEKKNKAIDLIETAINTTHGMPGALGFMYLNDKARQFKDTDDVDEATSRLILDWAAVGIMMHDMPGIYWGGEDTVQPMNPILRLDFEKDPLSCLISLADILEEFERPKAEFDEDRIDKDSDDERLKYRHIHECEKSSIEIENGILKIDYYYNKKEYEEKNKEHREKEVLQYLNLENGYINLKSWGITEAHCETHVIKNEKIVTTNTIIA